MISRLGLAGVVAGALLVGAPALPATAATPAPPPAPPVPVVTDLGGPLHLTFGPDGSLYIADAFRGTIVRADVDTGTKTVLAAQQGFSPGVGVAANGSVYFTRSGQPEAGQGQGPTSLQRIAPDGTTSQVADLLAYELRNNPDRQPQLTGPDADALSNPYDVVALPGRVLVADAGANDILSVSPRGKVRTLTVLPSLLNGPCAKAPNNGVPNGGCDAVPTAMALGPDGYLYVTGLGAEVRGRIYKIDINTGEVVQRFLDFPPLTGIAVGDDGTIYASSLFKSRVYRIATDGSRTATSVPAVTDVALGHGALYAGSLAGAVFRVELTSFTALP